MRQAIEHRLTQAWRSRAGLSYLLWPISVVFGALVALRQRLYAWGVFTTHRLPVPVVVVGNVMAGGVGKTPIVIALVEHLTQQGFHVGVVTRGYGRHAEARNAHPIDEVKPNSLASQVGDEPLLIAKRCQVPVWVGSNRVAVARALLAAHPQVQVLISDDGLQHIALARDIELCVFDERGIGNGWLLPAGPLREPWPRRWLPSNVHRFDLITSDTALLPALFQQAYKVQRRLSNTAYQADGTQRPLSHWLHEQSLERLHEPAQAPVQALAGIAKPQAFFDMLKAQGIQLNATTALPDHADFQHLPITPASGDVLCTEKDAVKLWQTLPHAWAVPLITELPPLLLHEIKQALQQAMRLT